MSALRCVVEAIEAYQALTGAWCYRHDCSALECECAWGVVTITAAKVGQVVEYMDEGLGSIVAIWPRRRCIWVECVASIGPGVRGRVSIRHDFDDVGVIIGIRIVGTMLEAWDKGVELWYEARAAVKWANGLLDFEAHCRLYADYGRQSTRLRKLGWLATPNEVAGGPIPCP